MSRVVWLNGQFVDAATAGLSIDDPGVRSGVGLFETMRGQDGVVPWLERHLARLERSIGALGLDGLPAIPQVRDAVAQVAAACDPGPVRVRVTVTPAPTLLVDATPTDLDPDATLSAVSLPGTWCPGRRVAEHKTLSFLAWHDAERQARARGADTALLLDADGRLGEAARANVFCVIAGELVTTPVSGILPGVTREVVLQIAPVREAILDESTWRQADEMFVTSAVRGVVPITRCDDRVLEVGPITRAVQRQIDARLRS